MDQQMIEYGNWLWVNISSFIVSLVAAGGSAAIIAYGLFRLWGEKWIEGKFNRELEQARYELNSLFNRVSKIHEKEMEVLPEAWYKLQKALTKMARMTARFKQYPNLDRMSEDELQEFIKDSPTLKDYQKKMLLDAPNKNDYYRGIQDYFEIQEAYTALFEFHEYIQYNRIFLSADLFQQFKKVDDIFYLALVDSQEGIEIKDYKMQIAAYESIQKDGKASIDEIERLVQKRLRHKEAI